MNERAEEVVFMSQTEVVTGRFRIHIIGNNRLIVNEYTTHECAVNLSGGWLRMVCLEEER